MNISKDDVLAYPDQVHRTYPSTVRNAIRSVVRPFIEQSMTVTNTVFRVFDQRLGLPEGTLEGLHARDMHSGSETRLIKAPPMPGQDTAERATIGAHTDFGSLVSYMSLSPLPRFFTSSTSVDPYTGPFT